MVSDEALMLQFQSGSRESFEELFARYRDPLYGFFRRRLTNKERAEDLAQETWIAVLRAAFRYRPQALFRTYLYGIAFKLLSGERRRSTRQEAAITSAEVAASEAPQSYHWVREALDKLDPTEREIIMLREYEQLSYAEISALLHIPINTVRSRLFRTRLTFKRLLEPNANAITAQER